MSEQKPKFKLAQETIEVFDGISIEIKFNDNLNIISGENGTGKSTVLAKLLGKYKSDDNVYGVSPKRQIIAEEIEQAASRVSTGEKNKEKMLAELKDASKIVLAGYANYPAFTELFVIKARELYDKSDGSEIKKTDAYNKIIDEFNNVIDNIFDNIELVTDEVGEIFVKKGETSFPVSALSMGERELINLIINLHFLKDSYDVFLIDEPEIHLNWVLEEKLFAFLNNLANQNNKQIIVATHSRISFANKYKNKSLFLKWEQQKIQVESKPSEESIAKLAGDSVQFIDSYILDLQSEKIDDVVFVEDDNHEFVIKFICEQYNKNVHIIQCHGKPKVLSIVKLLDIIVPKCNYWGLVDSDNEEVEKGSSKHVLCLEKYNIENYFLDKRVLADLLDYETEGALSDKIKEIVKKHSLGNVKIFSEITDLDNFEKYLSFYHDAKRIIVELVRDKFDWKHDRQRREEFIREYIDKARGKSILEDIFGEITGKLK